MPIVLQRVDERLIHGQVVVGWGGHLRPDRYVVVDDALAASQWEQELYTLGAPQGVGVEFVAVPEARAGLPSWRASDQRTILLTRDLATMAALAENGLLEGTSVNLGGLHLREGREEVLSYLFLDETDRTFISGMAEEGVAVSAQDLPGSQKVGLETLLE